MNPIIPKGANGSEPQKPLSVLYAVAIILGVVIGAGIFKTPSLVAANSGSQGEALLVWLAGGFISLMGALCYAELTSTYPHTGGDYYYLFRAFGRSLSFLFAWARMTVIQTGSIAMTAFLIGDYASAILPLGPYSASYYAALTILFLTGVSLLVLRRKEPAIKRPFQVPLYPLIPSLFIAVCLYMLYSSLMVAGKGALVGVGVLSAGLPLLFFPGFRGR